MMRAVLPSPSRCWSTCKWGWFCPCHYWEMWLRALSRYLAEKEDMLAHIPWLARFLHVSFANSRGAWRSQARLERQPSFPSSTTEEGLLGLVGRAESVCTVYYLAAVNNWLLLRLPWLNYPYAHSSLRQHHSSVLVLDSADRKGSHRAFELGSRGSHGLPWSCHPPHK